jgi:formylglycine-generating enzyme required for sulfatase activity
MLDKKQKFHSKKFILAITVFTVLVFCFFSADNVLAELSSIWTMAFKELPLMTSPAKCPPDMVWVAAGKFCIDKYEASNGGGLYYVDINGDGDTADIAVNVYGDGTTWNETTATAKAVSVYNATPWVSLNQVQAKAACLAAGKHLATNYELLLAAKGTPDPHSSDPGDDSEPCNIWTNSKPSGSTWSVENQAIKTGTATSCVSTAGAYDLIGNVWEWADNVIYNGLHPATGVALPAQNYIRGLDIYGLPTSTGSSTADYNYDHFWISASGYRGFIRGGSWSSGANAGLFALYLGNAPSSAGASIGFRCAK